MRMGKTQKRKTRITLAFTWNPAHNTISGIRATVGVEYRALMYGSNAYSTVARRAMTIPTGIPMTIASPSPSARTTRLPRR
jgi:hypothetical protein